ncbi:hypothetical protein B0H16DRAFT_1791371 [Mycena metata]|uniref:Uncharacterized protein n=1 Tax=Mycena metata TaxID=1033252 RepID=A0AAD7JKL7_9AGAR|nr:hypothetical protein B0H16DRAFT_1791371 [Mycena metata]
MPATKRARAPDSSDEEEENRPPSLDSRASSRSPSPELRDDLPADELYKIARFQQKKANKATKALQAAQRKLTDITNEDDTPPKRGRPKKRKVDSGSEDDTKEVKNLAHKFTVMNLLWMRDLKCTFNTDVDEQYDPLARWENWESKVQGQLADLLEILPPKFRGETMHAQWFINTFHVEMGTQRSNIANRVRRCAPEVFNCAATDVLTSESRRDKFRKQIGYVEQPGGKSKYETFKVDLLHKNYNGKFDVDTVFRGDALHLAFAGVTHGPGAVTALKASGQPTQATGKCVSQLWHLTNSTPGSISASGILARWAVSADIELTPRGAQTGIDWQGDLEKYIEYLQNGLNKRKNLFSDSSMQDAMDMLDADEEEEPAEEA